MPIRLIDIYVPAPNEPQVDAAVKDRKCLGYWRETQSGDLVHIQVLVETEKAEGVLDDLERHLSGVEGYRIVILPVVASIPRPKPPEKGEPGAEPEKPEKKPALRISREELYAQVQRTVTLSPVFFVLVIMSSIVAAVGLLRDSPAVVIAAMVIAPMLGPNMALSLSATLADFPLFVKAVRAAVLGTLLALGFAVVVGRGVKLDLAAAEIAARTRASLGDVALALASGVAGALAFTTNAATWLVGVMVAVALLPPLVICGMFVGSRDYHHAGGALLLFLTNIICVNLAAIATFVMQGVRPRTWWEANKAKRATRIALLVWGAMLATLVVVILISQRRGG